MPMFVKMRSPLNKWPYIFGAVLSALLAAQGATAQVRLRFPEPDPGGPVYARVERPFLVHTDEYAAVVFYRDPACVPGDFNLLNNVDLAGFPDNPRAFRCPMTVEGFQIWTTYQFPGPPNHVFTQGTGAVPVWLVAWSEMQLALADDNLTIGELRSMRSLRIGHAVHFTETLQLSPTAQTQAINFVASGSMMDGRSFKLTYVFRHGTVVEIQIRLR